MTRRGWWIVLLIWIGVIARSTLHSAPHQAAAVAQLHWYCVVCGPAGTADLLLNILLFFPVGLALRAVDVRLMAVLALAIAMSTSIEVVQGTLLVGRDAALGDVIANTSGAVVGWLALPLLTALARRERRTVRVAAPALTLFVVALWCITALAFETRGSWAVHRTPIRDGVARFDGQLLQASINGQDVNVAGPVAIATLRDSIDLGIDLQVHSAPDTGAPRRLLRMLDSLGHPAFDVSEEGADLVLEFPLRGSTWGFHRPQWTWTGAFTSLSGHEARFDARLRPGLLTMGRLTDRSESDSIKMSLSVADGWMFIHPYVSRITSRNRWWSLPWIAWWMAIIGWLTSGLNDDARPTLRTVLRLITYGAAALGSMLLIGIASRMPPTGPEVATAVVAYLMAVVTGTGIKREV